MDLNEGFSNFGPHFHINAKPFPEISSIKDARKLRTHKYEGDKLTIEVEKV
jgi:hypothetical protein